MGLSPLVATDDTVLASDITVPALQQDMIDELGEIGQVVADTQEAVDTQSNIILAMNWLIILSLRVLTNRLLF